MTFLFPVWDRWNHNKYLVQMTNPVIAISYNKLWWPSGKYTWLSHRQSGFKSRRDLFEEKFFLCLCFTKDLIPKSRNLYLSTPMDDFINVRIFIFSTISGNYQNYSSLLIGHNYSLINLDYVSAIKLVSKRLGYLFLSLPFSNKQTSGTGASFTSPKIWPCRICK